VRGPIKSTKHLIQLR